MENASSFPNMLELFATRCEVGRSEMLNLWTLSLPGSPSLPTASVTPSTAP